MPNIHSWCDAFTEHLKTHRHNSFYAAEALTHTARLVIDTTDPDESLAQPTARRERRIQAVPAPLRPAVRAFADALMSQPAGLQQFFSHAHHTGLILHNPAATLDAPQQRGFKGATITLDEQRALYRRWSTSTAVLPHEAFIGLAALLHAATTTELRGLTLDQISIDSRTVRFPGRTVGFVHFKRQRPSTSSGVARRSAAAEMFTGSDVTAWD
ncbi:hypothetical protein [Streptomyces sp. NPDC002676]